MTDHPIRRNTLNSVCESAESVDHTVTVQRESDFCAMDVECANPILSTCSSHAPMLYTAVDTVHTIESALLWKKSCMNVSYRREPETAIQDLPDKAESLRSGRRSTKINLT